MPKEHPIKVRIRERIKIKEAELPAIDTEIANLQGRLAELTVRREAIIIGVDEDESLLADSTPKFKRVLKAKPPQSLGQQMGTEAQEGQA